MQPFANCCFNWMSPNLYLGGVRGWQYVESEDASWLFMFEMVVTLVVTMVVHFWKGGPKKIDRENKKGEQVPPKRMWLKKSLSYLSIAEVSLNFHDLGRVKCLKMHRGEWIIVLKLSIFPEIWYKVFSPRKKVAKVSVQYIQYNLFHHERSPNFETQPFVNAIYHIYIYIETGTIHSKFNTHSFCWKVWFHHHPHVLKPQQKGSFSVTFPLPGSSVRGLFKGEKFVTSIWVVNLGHEWKKLAG